MRVVAGKLRGRSLLAPDDQRVRPTSDRVREAMFNILEHSIPDFSLQGAFVLDLFSGTGALGIEALSRGATSCVFIDSDAEACRVVQRNLDHLRLADIAQVYRRSAIALGQLHFPQPFQLAFLDPPYGKALGEQALFSAAAGGWLADHCIVVLEERAGIAVSWPSGFDVLTERSWGNTTVAFARYAKPVKGATDPTSSAQAT